jgi:predicted nucleic acid-binding protein
MTAVFADTVYFLALVNRKDQAHQKSVAFSQGTDRPLVTTEWVLMEVGDALCRGKDREVFQLLLNDLAQSPAMTVISADKDLFNKAVALFGARPDKDWSLTDCTSFVVMDERQLTDALTSDHHFEQAGFLALLA